jgi:hypothetical protein
MVPSCTEPKYTTASPSSSSYKPIFFDNLDHALRHAGGVKITSAVKGWAMKINSPCYLTLRTRRSSKSLG